MSKNKNFLVNNLKNATTIVLSPKDGKKVEFRLFPRVHTLHVNKREVAFLTDEQLELLKSSSMFTKMLDAGVVNYAKDLGLAMSDSHSKKESVVKDKIKKSDEIKQSSSLKQAPNVSIESIEDIAVTR